MPIPTATPNSAAASAIHAHPAWFGAVMGTGALALALASESAHWPSRAQRAASSPCCSPARTLVALGPRYLARLGPPPRRPGDRRPRPRADAGDVPRRDPRAGPRLGTHRRADRARVRGRTIAIALLGLGVLAALAFGIAWTAILLRSTIDVEQVNGGWLIPPVMTLLVPLGVQPVMQRFPGATPLLGVVAFAFLGIGGLLFLALFGLLMLRLTLHAPLPAALAPSLVIPLAPAPVLGLATLRVLQMASAHGVPGSAGSERASALSAVGLGFAGWWLAVVASNSGACADSAACSRIRDGGASCSPSAPSRLTFDALGTAMSASALVWTGSVVTVVLLAIWVVIAARTARELFL